MKKKITTGLCVIAFISFLGICNYTHASVFEACVDAEATAVKKDVENINCNKAYKEVCIKINGKDQNGKRHQ